MVKRFKFLTFFLFLILPLQSTVELKHSSELNFHLTQISDKATYGKNLTVGSKLPEVRSSEKANKPISNAKHLAGSLCVPASVMGTSDVCFRQSLM